MDLQISGLDGLWMQALLWLALATPLPSAAQEVVRQWQFQPRGDGRGYELALEEVRLRQPGPNEVVVRVRATSLNRRDHSILTRTYGSGSDVAGGVPLSDGAGEVVAVGDDVTRFSIGDRVAGTFFERWSDGERTDRVNPTARGGGGPNGMLAEMVVTTEEGLVEVPDHLSWEEAATLPCAAVTAWVGLFRYGDLQPGDWVLLEGTGGVSSFGLLLAEAAGARTIITSSSDEKLERARRLGADGTVNYRDNPEWQEEVRTITGGHGVDHVLEIGGEETLPRALEALGYEGHVALIGGLTGFGASVPVSSLMGIDGRVTGIYVGSRADFEAMNEFLEEHEIRPIVDRVFDFEEAPEAFDFMENGDFMGKIVIRL